MRAPVAPSIASAGSRSTSKLPAIARWMPSSSVVRLDRGEEADVPKLTAKTGTSRPAKRRSAARIVPSPPSTTADRALVAPGREPSTTPSRGPCLCVSTSSGGSRTSTPASSGELDQPRQSLGRLPGRLVGEDRDRARRGSRLHLAAAASTSASARPARPRPATQSSRGCPPGRAGPTRRNRARPAELSAVLANSHERRAAVVGMRTTPPFPTRSRPTSNWGFTSARQSKRSAPRRRARPEAPSSSEMNDTSTTIRSGR